ncbi:MAG: 16S rRNA (cytosine(967)-C(5))-methyltransferase RsmB [Eubacteriales bacterium]|nr:16S rRNA (cytosine(967)-C(5))-methyltransferase RsmB [Eubacteriales bacterium]
MNNSEKKGNSPDRKRNGKSNIKSGGVNVRKTALDLLCGMEENGVYSNIGVDAAIKRTQMSREDRALFTALVYGTVERRITLDFYINSFSSMAPEKIESRTRNILRLGAYQIIYLDRIPDRAAVNECVALCGRSSSGFVNALLRRLSENKRNLPMPDKSKKPYRYLSVKYSFPQPLCRRFSEIFGMEKTEKILAAFCERAKDGTVIRVNTLKIPTDKLKKKLTDMGTVVSDGIYSDTALHINGGNPPDLASSDGEFFVQDEASQLCVKVLGAMPGETVIDMCSAPGSKSFGAAIEMNNRGKILAFDLHESKLSLIEDGAKRLGIDIIHTAAADGLVFDPALAGTADRIICDVPCSGFGVCAKKPEIRYRSPDECTALPDIQLGIALNAAKYLKPGGTMIYSTCTLLPEENQSNVERLLENCPELEIEREDFTVGGISSENGMLTLTPDLFRTDGFFIAKLKKRGADR